MNDFPSGVRCDPIVVSAESTVVAEYVSETADEAATSLTALERGFISALQSQAFEYPAAPERGRAQRRLHPDARPEVARRPR